MNLGGPAHQVALLSGRRLDPDRYETLLVHGSVPTGEDSMADAADREGAQALHLPELGQPIAPLRDAGALRRLTAICREFAPDIVHTHTAKAGFVGRAAALRTSPRPRIVHTFHGHVLRGYFGPVKTRAFLEAERRMGRVSDVLVGVSQETVDELVALRVAPRERFRVVPLGLDLAPYAAIGAGDRAAARERFGLGPDDVVLAFVGRFAPIKRLDVLLDAFAAARGSDSRLRLLLVGDGEERAVREARARELGLAEAVSFLGYSRDLPAIAAVADVAVLSSDNEGTPVWLIEAGAAGLPAVATAVGGVPAVVSSETGLLAPPGDARMLAQAINELAADGDRRARMGAAARARSLERFGADRLVADIDALYTELVGG
jgi:glycosyltransferase involved in cell wall biosynthesis